MKKQTLKKLALGKKTISTFEAIASIKGGITPTTTMPSFICAPDPSGGNSEDILCPSGPIVSKTCDTRENSCVCPI
jgi:hypothetical protein